MRDSFGGVFMFRLLLVFIFIFVAFTAVSLNSAKSFRVKNKVIDFIEQNEITQLSGKNFTDNLPKLEAIIKSSDYNKSCEKGDGTITSKEGNLVGYCYKGIVILKDSEENIEGTKSKRIQYQVITYADWNLGALNKLLVLGGKQENSESYVNGTWQIIGTAKVIANK